jgi:hypothetical protein
MNSRDLTHLHGQSVLVKSTADHRDPPIALRGTLEARPDPRGQPEVKIVLEYPDMNNSAARQGVIPLDEAGVDRLLANEHDGVFEYTIERPLDPGPEPAGPQAVS